MAEQQGTVLQHRSTAGSMVNSETVEYKPE